MKIVNKDSELSNMINNFVRYGNYFDVHYMDGSEMAYYSENPELEEKKLNSIILDQYKKLQIDPSKKSDMKRKLKKYKKYLIIIDAIKSGKISERDIILDPEPIYVPPIQTSTINHFSNGEVRRMFRRVKKLKK